MTILSRKNTVTDLPPQTPGRKRPAANLDPPRAAPAAWSMNAVGEAVLRVTQAQTKVRIPSREHARTLHRGTLASEGVAALGRPVQ